MSVLLLIYCTLRVRAVGKMARVFSVVWFVFVCVCLCDVCVLCMFVCVCVCVFVCVCVCVCVCVLACVIWVRSPNYHIPSYILLPPSLLTPSLPPFLTLPLSLPPSLPPSTLPQA